VAGGCEGGLLGQKGCCSGLSLIGDASSSVCTVAAATGSYSYPSVRSSAGAPFDQRDQSGRGTRAPFMIPLKP
jgi:hypothetical protein